MLASLPRVFILNTLSLKEVLYPNLLFPVASMLAASCGMHVIHANVPVLVYKTTTSGVYDNWRTTPPTASSKQASKRNIFA